MALENVGRLRFGNTEFVLLNDYRVFDRNSNHIGTYRFNGNTVELVDLDGNLWATVSHDGTNYILAGADGTPLGAATWTKNPQWSEEMISDTGGVTGDNTGGTTGDTAFSTNTLAGTLTVGNHTYQVVNDSEGVQQLWEDGANVGYVVPGQNGAWNFYRPDGTPVSTIYPNGSVVMADGSPLPYTASYEAVAPITSSDTDSNAQNNSSTVTFYHPETGDPITFTLQDGALKDASGKYVGTYETTGPNEYSFFDTKHDPLGTYNSATGAFTGADGSHYTAHFTPQSGNALPDVSQVEGPWSTSDSQSTSYSGLDPKYQANVDQWMSDLSASMTPEAFQNLISGAYSKAAGQTNKAYEAAQSYLPEIYQQTLTPALQSGVNTLAKKNMLNSTVAGNTMAGAANLAYQSVLPQQAQLAGQQAGALSQLAGQEAQYQTAYPATLGGLVSNLGKYSATKSASHAESQNPLAPYGLIYGTLPYMAQRGTA